MKTTRIVTLVEAQENFSDLLKWADAGDDVVIVNDEKSQMGYRIVPSTSAEVLDLPRKRRERKQPQ